jgi:hypothetical protein
VPHELGRLQLSLVRWRDSCEANLRPLLFCELAGAAVATANAPANWYSK